MVTLRATQKVLKRLPPVSADDALSDTALGDWYVNRLVVDRQPLLLLVSSRSLLAIIEQARNLRQLPERLPGLVEQRLKRLEVEGGLIEGEVMAMHPVRVGPTRDGASFFLRTMRHACWRRPGAKALARFTRGKSADKLSRWKPAIVGTPKTIAKLLMPPVP